MPVKPLLVAFVVALRFSGPAGALEACLGLTPETPTVKLAGLDSAGDPVLTDGRTLRLVGIAPRQDSAEQARFAAGIAAWQGRDVRLVALGGVDRWGRQPARLLLVSEEAGVEPLDVSVALTGSGAASKLPEALAGCAAPRRIAKAPAARAPAAKAQPAALPTPADGVVDGHDIAALKVQAGRLVAIEGTVASVGERAQRTYLNFSRRRAEAGSIVMSRKLWREMQDAGWTASGLNGKRVRARGVLSGQDGLLLDVTSALALELID